MLIISRPQNAARSNFATGTLLNNTKAVMIAVLGLQVMVRPPEFDYNRTEIVGDQLRILNKVAVKPDLDFATLDATKIKSVTKQICDTAAVVASRSTHLDFLSQQRLQLQTFADLSKTPVVVNAAIITASAATKTPLAKADFT